jgi:predicted nucleic acid-binding protein
VCRDPKDDKFLEAALTSQADCLVTGDADLLVLDPFEGIPILRPAEFLARLSLG